MSLRDYTKQVEKIKSKIAGLESKLEFYEKRIKEVRLYHKKYDFKKLDK